MVIILREISLISQTEEKNKTSKSILLTGQNSYSPKSQNIFLMGIHYRFPLGLLNKIEKKKFNKC